jgi:hypothetical protein
VAQTDTCPRCGEKAINQTGHCVFFGAVVIAPKTQPTGKAHEKAMRQYQFASVSFLILGVLYLALGVIGTISIKSPMLGLFLVGILAAGQGGLLIYKNDWMQSVTKVICMVRLGIFLLILAILVPYFIVMKTAGLLFGLMFIWDIVCLIVMIRTIDDVYFA